MRQEYILRLESVGKGRPRMSTVLATCMKALKSDGYTVRWANETIEFIDENSALLVSIEDRPTPQ